MVNLLNQITCDKNLKFEFTNFRSQICFGIYIKYQRREIHVIYEIIKKKNQERFVELSLKFKMGNKIIPANE